MLTHGLEGHSERGKRSIPLQKISEARIIPAEKESNSRLISLVGPRQDAILSDIKADIWSYASLGAAFQSSQRHEHISLNELRGLSLHGLSSSGQD